MKPKRVLLLGGNFSPELTGIGKYNGEMMKWLAEAGYQCSVVTTFPYYPHWEVQAPYTGRSFWYKREVQRFELAQLTVYRCPHYVPKNPTGLKRMVSDLSFFISAFFQLLVLMFRKRYDYVISVVPPFQIGLLALLYKWLKGGRVIYHVQDLQVDAAKELGMIRSKPLLKLLFSVERFILQRSDVVSSISEGMIRKVQAKCGKTVRFFPNWVDTKSFYPLEHKEELKEKFGFRPDQKIVLYSGAIGEKQGLDAILSAALEMNDGQVQFVICGTGPFKEKLQVQAQSLGLQNVQFMPVQPLESFNQFLNIADVHLVLQKANADDLVMPSKLTTILSVGGLALVTASPNSSLHAVIAGNQIGYVVEPENHQALIAALNKALSGKNTNIRAKARSYAEQYLTMENVMPLFFDEVFSRKPMLRQIPAGQEAEVGLM